MFSRESKAATIPRTRTETGVDNQTFQPRGILKPSSGSSGHEVVNTGNTGNTGNTTHLEHSDHLYHGTRSASAGPLTLGDNQSEITQEPGPLFSFVKSPSRTCENIRVETAFVGNFESACDLDPSSGRKSVTIATKHEEREIEREELETPVDNEGQAIVVHKDCIRILAPQPQKLMPDSLRSTSHNSESPEWPSPPEPLTPQTPQTPTYSLEFDSDSIKRMLENLPVSPETDSMAGSMHEHDVGFHDNPCCTSKQEANGCCEKSAGEKSRAISESGRCDSRRNELDSAQLLQCEITRRECVRDSYGRDSNPDSGIGGMMCDLAVSLSSSESANIQTGGKRIYM